MFTQNLDNNLSAQISIILLQQRLSICLMPLLVGIKVNKTT